MFEKSIDQLTADISKWADKALSLLQKRCEAADRISTAELSAGNAILDAAEGESTNLPVEAVVRARAEVAAFDAAGRSCIERLADAKRAKRQGEAAVLRKQAAQLRSEMESIEAKVAKHLAAVADLQGAQFRTSTALGSGLPRTEILQTQIGALEGRAQSLEGELPRSGALNVEAATSVDALLAAVLRYESETPTVQDILDWAVAFERGHEFGGASRRYRLVWRDGVIDAESYTQVTGLVRSTPGPFTGSPVYELGSDLFRAGAA
jgi:chromosome segregation ATPase